MTGNGYELRLDVPYASGSNSMDIFTPYGKGPFPGILLIHGGAFQSGSKQSYAGWAKYFATRGMVAAAIDYSLASPGAPSYPANIHDCKAAVRFLRANSSALRLDPDKLAVLGGSAGAYLAAMLVLTSDDAAWSQQEGSVADVSDRVSVGIAIAGLYDLIGVWEHDQLHRPAGQHVEMHLGGNPMTARRLYYEASPLYHASEENARNTRWLISWGTRDDVVPPDQSESLVLHLKRAGAVVRTVPIEGASHFWYLDRPNEGIDDPDSYTSFLAPRILTFLGVWCGWELTQSSGPAGPRVEAIP